MSLHHKRRILSLVAFVAFLLSAQSAMAQSALARTFNGSSDNLQSASTVNLSSTKVISLSFWLYWDAFSNDDKLAFESSSNYNSNTGTFIVDVNSSSPNNTFTFSVHDSGYLACSFAWPSATAWHHYLLILDNTTGGAGTCSAYVDGISAAPSVAVNTASGSDFGDFTLNVMSRNASSLFGAGRISDIAIWKSALTSGDATSLAACTNPSLIGTVAFYWPINQVSPETASTGGVNLTVNGTSNSAASCTAGAATTNGLTLLGVGK